jgi:predicted RNA-binding Zn ribbon-like protein
MSRRAQWVTVLGERACLDLVNSANWEGDAVADEAFETPADVIDWAEHASLVTKAVARQWRVHLPRDPSATTLVAEIRALRQALRDLFAAAVDGTKAPARASAVLNARLRSSGPGLLAASGTDVSCVPDRGAWSQWLLHRLAASGLELLVSRDRVALKMCDGNRCGWFFLDRTRAHTRRWCEMETCGNRAKARRHYLRATRP